MGWEDYYRLLIKYKGNLRRVKEEVGGINDNALMFAIGLYKERVKDLILAIINLEEEVSYVRLAKKVEDYIEGDALKEVIEELIDSGDIFESRPNMYRPL